MSPRKKLKISKSNTKIAHKGKAAQKFVKKSPETPGRKSEGLLGVQKPQPLKRIGQL